MTFLPRASIRRRDFCLRIIGRAARQRPLDFGPIRNRAREDHSGCVAPFVEVAAMANQRIVFASAMLASAFAVAAGVYDAPYALIETGDPSEVRREFRPAISQIDGATTERAARANPVAPGKHKVTVQFQTARVTQSPAEERREIEIDAKACVRYRVVAARTSGTNWEPKVYEEKIGECTRKFDKKAS
jgi:hypothetical protein